MIPPITPPADTDMVKRIKIQSQILTKWWGQPIFLGATILLPKDYDEASRRPLPGQLHPGALLARRARAASGAAANSTSSGWPTTTPRFIYVTLQHPSPYYDDSYAVNSENNGPYGDAIMQELLPAIETQFRVIRQPWARMLSGGSTGGWIAAAHQVFYPDFYGGAFASCPDSVDFNYHQIVNIYKDPNAYFIEHGWMKVDRPTQRRPDGNIVVDDEGREPLRARPSATSRARAASGTSGRRRSHRSARTATRCGIWDKETGVIDHAVAEKWKKYDLLEVLKTNWTTLGPKIGHKLNIYVGDMDSYYLNDAVENLNAFWQKAGNPRRDGRDRLPAPRPPLLGPARAGTAREDDEADRRVRAAGSRHEVVAVRRASARCEVRGARREVPSADSTRAGRRSERDDRRPDAGPGVNRKSRVDFEYCWPSSGSSSCSRRRSGRITSFQPRAVRGRPCAAAGWPAAQGLAEGAPGA